MGKKKCQICGKDGYMYYPFCKEHLEMKNKGLLEKCDNCDNWHIKTVPCSCSAPKVTAKTTTAPKQKTCKYCGKPSGQYDVCKECYYKKDKATTAKPTKTTDKAPAVAEKVCKQCGKPSGQYDMCKECYFKSQNTTAPDYSTKAIVKEIDATDVRKKWETMIRTTDGHYVRSYSEKAIDDWLYNNGIVHAYEKKVFFKENPDKTVIADFYLPEGKIYIEFFGLNTEDYLKRVEEKKSLFESNKLNLICLGEEHMKNLDDVLGSLIYQYINA